MEQRIDTQAHERALAAQYAQQVSARRQRITKLLDTMVTAEANLQYGRWTATARAILPDYNPNTCDAPSKHILRHSKWLFGDIVLPRFKDAFLYAVDHMTDYSYDTSWLRRGFRSDRLDSYYSRIGAMTDLFIQYGYIDADICDILTGKLPEEVLCYLKTLQPRPSGFAPEVLAYALDRNDPALEAVITDIIMGDNRFTTVSHNLIRGIVMSHNPRMHKLLCDLLLAARLQEGLRQAICENADYGTREAFLAILDTIIRNDLIRFSSVKRAVGTWTGLVAEETRDLSRISQKTLELMQSCLSDADFRSRCLQSEDSMELYMGLWSIAVRKVEDAFEVLSRILDQGSHHQILTAGYFLHALNLSPLSHRAAIKVLQNVGEHKDLLAIYLPYFLPHHIGLVHRGMFAKAPADWTTYFTDRTEAQALCDLLTALYHSLDKKEYTFDPCVFPWHKAVLRRSELLEKAMVTAVLIDDTERIDALCPLLPSADADRRDVLLSAMTGGEKTPAVRAAIIKGLSDKSEYVRRKAFARCKELTLTPAEYRSIEDLLRLRYEDLRRGVTLLLLQQSDTALEGSITRLLAATKAEKRTAALDMLTTLSKDDGKKTLVSRCLPHVRAIANPTAQEKILIENLLPKEAEDSPALPYTEADRYIPAIVLDDYAKKCIRTFMGFFPDSRLEREIAVGKPVSPAPSLRALFPCAAAKTASGLLKELSAYITAHETEFFERTGWGPTPIGTNPANFLIFDSETRTFSVPRMDLWTSWTEQRKVTVPQLAAMLVLSSAQSPDCPYLLQCGQIMEHIFGSGFRAPVSYPYKEHMCRITQALLQERLDPETRRQLGIAIGIWISHCLPDPLLLGEREKGQRFIVGISNGEQISHYSLGHFLLHPQVQFFLGALKADPDAHLSLQYPLLTTLCTRSIEATRTFLEQRLKNPLRIVPVRLSGELFDHYSVGTVLFNIPDADAYLLAYEQGVITEGNLYYLLMQPHILSSALELVTSVCCMAPTGDTPSAAKSLVGYNGVRMRRRYESFIGKDTPLTEAQQSRIDLCRRVADTLVPIILEAELKRGDSPAEYSPFVKGIQSLTGAQLFVGILQALGKDTLDRGQYYGQSGYSRRANLSYLLGHCAPASTDTAETLGALLRDADISQKRLIEAALYSPDWIDLIGAHLDFPAFKSACYYFIAHMNEQFDGRKMAVIARFTPLSDDELNSGAFDLQWFRSAYEQLGEKRFDMIYDAAKYISDGSKHTRARKYADAALGRLDVAETEAAIRDKRNKDLLMAYPLIPLTDEEDLYRRYLFLQQFLKESRSFGAQRANSEKRAVETALRNLATNAGYGDTTRLTLQMEARPMADEQALYADTPVGEWMFRLTVDERGTADIRCTKDGKLLRSIPAKAKKDPHVQRLQEAKKQLTEQHRRTRIMFEQAMEDGTAFTLGELNGLLRSPVAAPILSALFFRSEDGIGRLDGEGLVDLDGTVITHRPDAELITAHPYDLYQSGRWQQFQRYLFDNKLVQPFKQVFRELYVKTADELGSPRSLRYAGNQIQPRKAAACLKGRRWVTDVETGLQKVYYKENIVAAIYALADWFSPSDIEAPTLEWVEFYHRRTGKPIPIDDVPPIIFSEVMRDVDLAVSVAHAGGVDPEASHSTVEMRGALLEFMLPLLGLENVTVKDNHAIIRGSLGEYTVHLGSGVVHQIGGTMLSVLPVHSQHRGRIFLPFVDDDPKTAEIVSKVILFSEDKKLKDPTILEQITH